MPPPTPVDSWLASRRFGVVRDAGSSGSRLQIYSWKAARAEREGRGADDLHSLPQVGKGTEKGEEWSVKVEAGKLLPLLSSVRRLGGLFTLSYRALYVWG